VGGRGLDCTVADCCDQCNEPSGCRKCGPFIDHVKKYWLRKKGFFSMHRHNLGVGGGVQGGGQMPLQYFLYLRIVFFLATELKRGK
jgi:hypothetical protein